MTPQEYQIRLRATIKDLELNRVARTQIAARGALAILQRRIHSKGEKSDGTSFGKYSDAKVPFWFFENKETQRNAKQQAEAMRKKVGYFASYKDWREQHGLQTEHKDFVFTARMQQNIIPRLLSHSVSKTVIEIGASQAKEKKKLEYITQREGEYLKLSKSEQKFLFIQNLKRVQDALRKNLII